MSEKKTKDEGKKVVTRKVRLAQKEKITDSETKQVRIFWRAYLITFALIMVFTFGMIGFMVTEGMTALNAFHMVMQTLTTVGYGDLPPQTTEGRIISDIVMIFSVTIAAFGAASLMDYIVSGKLRETMRITNYARMISDLSGHVIVCGYSRVGKAAVSEFIGENVPFVVIDHDKEAMNELDTKIPRIVGDATKDEDLFRCGLKRSVAIIVALGNDADNLMALVTAKYIKPGIIGITRSNVEEDKEKFLKVGADMVISPETEGGRSMAQMLKDSKDKVIVAGYGRVGMAASQELQEMGVPVVVMDRDPMVLESIPKNINHISGDATKETDLRMAGIDKAAALITAYGLDSDNLLATLTAKYFRPSITVISRASNPGNVKKILKVGADVVISPESEGGKSMAKWATQAVTMAKQDE